MALPAAVTSSLIGANFNQTSTTALFALRTKAFGTEGSEWLYVHSNTAHTTGQLLAVNSVGTAQNCTTVFACSGISTQGADFGFVPSVAWTAGDYGWICTRGLAYVQCSGTTVPNNQLYTANSAGGITTTASSGTLIGIELVASASTASLVVTTAILTWPRSVPLLG